MSGGSSEAIFWKGRCKELALARLNAVERTLDEAECLLQSIMKRAGRSARVILHPILLAMPLNQAIDEKRLIRWSVASPSNA